jgi:hypothetical protein
MIIVSSGNLVIYDKKHTADHPGVILSGGLKRSTNDSPPSSKCDCLNTTIAVAEGTTNKTAHESAEIVD